MQGIANPVVTAALPDLNSQSLFLRGTVPGNSGTVQGFAMQGHTHTTAASGVHSHTIQSAGAHTHTEVGFALTNCDWCGAVRHCLYRC
jgi:hypothetical protein